MRTNDKALPSLAVCNASALPTVRVGVRHFAYRQDLPMQSHLISRFSLGLRGALILATLGLTAWIPTAQAGDIYIACSAGVALTVPEMRDVFLGEKQFAGTVKLVPVDNSSIQADFLDKVMKMDATKYSTAWTKKSFRDGATAPPVKGSDGEVVEFLKHTAGACGYLGSAPPAGLSAIGKV